jgi:hypothetical protein
MNQFSFDVIGDKRENPEDPNSERKEDGFPVQKLTYAGYRRCTRHSGWCTRRRSRKRPESSLGSFTILSGKDMNGYGASAQPCQVTRREGGSPLHLISF